MISGRALTHRGTATPTTGQVKKQVGVIRNIVGWGRWVFWINKTSELLLVTVVVVVVVVGEEEMRSNGDVNENNEGCNES